MKVYPTAKIIVDDLDIDQGSFIGDFVFIALKRLKMDEGAQINAHSSLTGGGEVILGRNVVVSYGARLISGTDQPAGKYMSDYMPEEERDVVRGTIFCDDGSFIGANAVVTVCRRHPEIVIGRNTVVGSGVYVDHSIEANMLVIPRKRLLFRPREIF